MSTKHILKIPRENYSTGDVAFPYPPLTPPLSPCFANSFRDRDTRLTLFDPVMKIYGYFSYFLITTASNSCILNRFVVIRQRFNVARIFFLSFFFFFLSLLNWTGFCAQVSCPRYARVRNNAGYLHYRF